MIIQTPPAPIDRLHEQLEQKATGANEPAVHYRLLDTPIGQLLLAGTEFGVVRIAFESEGEDTVLQSLASKISPRILHTPKRLDDAARWLDAYLAGTDIPMSLPLDERLMRGYRREVLGHLREVGYGRQISYQHLAQETSSPRAVRAVGSACATNPLPLLIPCHRVVRTDGGLGAYLGGIEVKRRLLKLEATGVLPG